MKTTNDILREMREYADKQERMGFYDLRDLSTETLRVYADRIEAAHERDCEYPKAQSLDADKLTGKTISGLATDLRQIAKYHYARGNIAQGQFARVMADRIEAAHKQNKSQ